MDIVTGYLGRPHISAEDARSLNRGIFGNGAYILSTGNKLNATIEHNKVNILDGDMVVQGMHVRIPTGQREIITPEPGTQRNEKTVFVILHYEKNKETQVESVKFITQSRDGFFGWAAEPVYTKGDLSKGDIIMEEPFLKICMLGTEIDHIFPLFNYVSTLGEGSCIIETGGLEDDPDWIAYKFGNGIMELTQKVKTSIKMTTSIPPLYQGLADLGRWGIPFFSEPVITSVTNNSAFSFWFETWETSNMPNAIKIGSAYFTRETAADVHGAEIIVTAKGRWK